MLQRFRTGAAIGPVRAVGFVVVLLLVGATGGAGAAERVAHAAPEAQIDTHLETIRIAFGMLLDVSAAAPSADALLEAAEQPLRPRASQLGIVFQPPTLPVERDAAFDAYAQVFRQVASGLADSDIGTLAFDAIDAMARSIGDAHTRFARPASNPSTRSAGILLGAFNAEVFVRETAPNGPAASAGVRPGDVLVNINGQDVP
ncbi:MAG: PDZ domain-containing protein, partial [Acidimicrobiales bacterium]